MRPTPTEAVRAAYAAITERAEPEVFISLVPERDALRAAEAVEARLAAGEKLPLAGLIAAVKDNIDVAGSATTAGCPAFAYLPVHDATSVFRLRAAGAIVIGKTNLDQFATGLVGTRSPYGAPSSVLDAERISGGSSSGSAVAVALGLVDLALGTDTAGSGRVPAALNGVIGLKPTRGYVPTTGVVPACPTLDCVSLFARDVATATLGLSVLAGPDGEDPLARPAPADAPLGPPPIVRVAAPDPSSLGNSQAPWRAAFEAALRRVTELGWELRTVDVQPLLEAGRLLYGGAFVAERHASVGAFVEAHLDQVDPVVGSIIAGAATLPAAALVADSLTAAQGRLSAAACLADAEFLLMPTVPEHPRHDEVIAAPVEVNARMGIFTTFCNLLDLAAIVLPAPGVEGFGVTFLAPAFSDQLLCDLAATFAGEPVPPTLPLAAEEIVVVGAHLSGQPLNRQLTERGGRLVGATSTTPDYRLFALDTTPPKPGLVPAAADGGAIEVEVWALPPAAYAAFIRDVSPPLAIGPVALADGSVRPGFVLAAVAGPDGAREITAFGGWLHYLSSSA